MGNGGKRRRGDPARSPVALTGSPDRGAVAARRLRGLDAPSWAGGGKSPAHNKTQTKARHKPNESQNKTGRYRESESESDSEGDSESDSESESASGGESIRAIRARSIYKMTNNDSADGTVWKAPEYQAIPAFCCRNCHISLGQTRQNAQIFASYL